MTSFSFLVSLFIISASATGCGRREYWASFPSLSESSSDSPPFSITINNQFFDGDVIIEEVPLQHSSISFLVQKDVVDDLQVEVQGDGTLVMSLTVLPLFTNQTETVHSEASSSESQVSSASYSPGFSFVGLVLSYFLSFFSSFGLLGSCDASPTCPIEIVVEIPREIIDHVQLFASIRGNVICNLPRSICQNFTASYVTASAVASVSTSVSTSSFSSTGTVIPECRDGIDNDGDGLIDWEEDLGCYSSEDMTEGGINYPQLDHGWSVFELPNGAKIVYVSDSQGDDINNGTSSSPLRTLAAAKSILQPQDWVLLKRGDTWFNQSLAGLGFGNSESEMKLISSYGRSHIRPKVLTPPKDNGYRTCCGFCSFLAIVGIEFYSKFRDPNSSLWEGYPGEANSGISLYCRGGGSDILIEDCLIRFYSNAVSITGAAQDKNTTLVPIQGVTIRRNVLVDSYDVGSHSQGVFAKGVEGLVIEENVFDHNGWNEYVTGGHATMYNHNMYLTTTANAITVRKNLILRASSMGIKLRCDYTDQGHDYFVYDNVFVEGELGLHIGGNEYDNPFRFRNFEISRNALVGIGRTAPSGRNFSSYVQTSDARDGLISDNLFLHQEAWNNAFAVGLTGISQENVTVSNNIAFNVRSSGSRRGIFKLSIGAYWSGNFTISNNTIIDETDSSVLALLFLNSTQPNLVFSDNTYYSTADSENWFYINSTKMGFTDWIAYSSETGGSNALPNFSDPMRNISSYHASIGKDATFESFLEEARTQSKLGRYSKDYTAIPIIKYLKNGFKPV